MKKNLTCHQARAEIMRHVTTLPSSRFPVPSSLGHVLAENIYAPFDLPRFTHSAMDGYAVRATDTAGASRRNPRKLAFSGTIAAGDIPRTSLKPGQAIAIMTGGKIPFGADAVVIVEKTARTNGTVNIFSPVHAGENIRNKGEIIQRGVPVLKKGRLIRPLEIGILATLNCDRIRVIRKPRIAIFSTGSELVPVGTERIPSEKITDSNRHMIIAALQSIGLHIFDLGIVKDNPRATQNAIRRGIQNSDALITIGGVSMGEFDYVRKAIGKIGRLIFWKVKMKPGGPQTFGKIKGKPVFGLPGNPVSALLVFHLFVLPAIRKMMGFKEPQHKSQHAILGRTIKGAKKKVHFVPVFIRTNSGRDIALPIPHMGSHDLIHWISADGVAEIPPDQKFSIGGSKVRVTPLSK